MKNSNKLIIEIGGGLGNQMFQYALYQKLTTLGRTCGLYYDDDNFIHNGFELNRAFDLDCTLLKKRELIYFLKEQASFVNKIKMKFSRTGLSYWEHDKGYEYKPDILKIKHSAYLQGCWLTEKYFLDIKEQVKETFKFKNINDYSKSVAEVIVSKTTTVSVHIRRGDYIKSDIHLNIDYFEYLQKAFKYFQSFFAEADIFIFSDDFDFTRRLFERFNIPSNRLHFIDGNKKSDSFNDMYLMSVCKHNVTSNSTFSWWGAWLNNFEKKIIISPKDWFANDRFNDNSIVPETWIAI